MSLARQQVVLGARCETKAATGNRKSKTASSHEELQTHARQEHRLGRRCFCRLVPLRPVWGLSGVVFRNLYDRGNFYR